MVLVRVCDGDGVHAGPPAIDLTQAGHNGITALAITIRVPTDSLQLARRRRSTYIDLRKHLRKSRNGISNIAGGDRDRITCPWQCDNTGRITARDLDVRSDVAQWKDATIVHCDGKFRRK